MDLESRGLPDLARRFLNGWMEHSGDYGALAVIDFYKTYRALVRAKVQLLRLGQQPDVAGVRRRVGGIPALCGAGGAFWRPAPGLSGDHARGVGGRQERGGAAAGRGAWRSAPALGCGAQATAGSTAGSGARSTRGGHIQHRGHGAYLPASAGLGLHGRAGGLCGGAGRHVLAAGLEAGRTAAGGDDRRAVRDRGLHRARCGVAGASGGAAGGGRRSLGCDGGRDPPAVGHAGAAVGGGTVAHPAAGYVRCGGAGRIAGAAGGAGPRAERGIIGVQWCARRDRGGPDGEEPL